MTTSDKIPWQHDTRWSPGASGADVPDTSRAAYSARWIDQGDMQPAGVVHDRQGVAFDDALDLNVLLGLMNRYAPQCSATLVERGAEGGLRINFPDHLVVHLRRSGGYVYCDAWLDPSTFGGR